MSRLHNSPHTEETSERAQPNARADSSTTTVRVYTSTSKITNDSYEKTRRDKRVCSYVGSRTAVHRYHYKRDYNDRVNFTIIHKRSLYSMPYWSNTRRYRTTKVHSIKIKNIAIQNLMPANTQSMPNLPGGSTAISSAGVDPSKLWTVPALAALPLTLYCQLALNASLAARASSRVSNRAEVFLNDRCPVLKVKLSQSLCFPDPRSA